MKKILKCVLSNYIISHCHLSTLKETSTIYALSSGYGRCGVAIIRVSGSQAAEVAKTMTKIKNSIPERKALLKNIYHPESNELLDKGLLLWFPGPHSFTGEDCCEFHVHGGSAVVTAIFFALSHFKGLCPAENGEFTKRAFFNGKLDLTEVEGLLDLIHAETEAQRKQALRQLSGDLGKLYKDWREDLLKGLADLEAYIDFSEDQNIEEDTLQRVIGRVKNLREAISKHLSDKRRGERLRNGVHITIVGEPNVGKSSLLNIICQKPLAIVSPIAGTTRDIIESAFNIGGYPVVINDTAGLRKTSDLIEKEGVTRALERAQQADLLLVVLDASHHSNNFCLSSLHKYLVTLGIIPRNSEAPKTLEDLEKILSCELIVVFNKSDLVDKMLLGNEKPNYCVLSCLTKDGIDLFLNSLQSKIEHLCGDPLAGSPNLTQARHRHHLLLCIEKLNAFFNFVESDVVLAAEELRMVLRQLGKITGQVHVEEILDIIFKDFCIGK